MGEEWFYVVAGEQQGPLTHERMREAVVAGELSRDVLVWNASMPEWQPAYQVPSLAPASPPPIPVEVSGSARLQHGPSEQSAGLLKRAMSSDGRFNRMDFGKIVLLCLLVDISLSLLSAAAAPTSWAAVALPYILIPWLVFQALILGLASVRRLHDLGLSGWLAVMMLVPVLNLGLLLFMLLAPSKPAGTTVWG